MQIFEIKKLMSDFFLEKCGADSEMYQKLIERMNNLEIEKKADGEFLEYYRSRVPNGMIPSGYYDPRFKKVFLRELTREGFAIDETIIHEIVHGLSDSSDSKLGFKQYNLGLGNGFNEMATCYITSQILGSGRRRRLFKRP